MLEGKNNYYILKDIFPANFYAGYTNPSIEGKLPEEGINLIASLKDSSSFAFMQQIHSAKIQEINTGGMYECDGIFTKEKKIMLIVKTADCLPLIFYSQSLAVIGVVHMGWRGALAGILENIPYDLASFKVVAGIGLRKCCYLVGDEFIGYPKFRKSILIRNRNYYLDPIAFAKEELLTRGLLENNFFDLDICSYCNQHAFPSCRRTGLPARTLSFICTAG